MKGQTSFETLFLLIIILSSAIIITSYYLSIHDETLALSVARNETLNQIAQTNSEITIKNITAVKNTPVVQITIDVEPDTQLDEEKISEAVKKATIFTDTVIIIE